MSRRTMSPPPPPEDDDSDRGTGLLAVLAMVGLSCLVVLLASIFLTLVSS